MKGWIRGNTKIGPAFGGGRYSSSRTLRNRDHGTILKGDGTCSWVIDYIGESTGKLVAKAKPKQTSTPTTSSTTTLPSYQREWMEVKPGPFDKSCFEVSKKMIRLLRHGSSVRREEDGEVEFYRCFI